MSTSALTSPTGAPGRESGSPERAVRTATTLMIAGVIAEYVVTMFHPAHAAPNDHPAAFAEYAASHAWIPVHLGQFAAGLVIVLGFLALLRSLRPTSRSPLTIRAAEAAAVLTAAVSAALQAVDGIALKRAVDSLATVPAGLRDAAFHDAETVRWLEESMAAYFRLTLGLTLVMIGLAVVSSRRLPRWTAGFAVLSGLAFIADGIGVGYSGFAGATPANLVAWASFATFAVATTVAAWAHRPHAVPPS
jgi:hypothetical protein